MVNECLAALGLTHYRTREALALATKVAHAPGVIAELCWSDDPDYTAGYVASLRQGYVRFPHLKELGDQRGGRVIFVDPAKLVFDELIEYLQDKPTIIDNVGVFKAAIGLNEYCKSLV
jgi:6-carboxyhexanoate--CoA ligase